ncbi:hypothetical protein HNO88_001762 [Novosphingobium chloroacetimidivorans]|uniref:Uncharacterized protein n=1 Tax=Novosphingobium chloroacetimidivorans TaxID=1428314 RepID=A0A7W7NWI0_9SPHN|nr:hypothetical protein [Novosphingobium chloroacetimidivorans]
MAFGTRRVRVSGASLDQPRTMRPAPRDGRLHPSCEALSRLEATHCTSSPEPAQFPRALPAGASHQQGRVGGTLACSSASRSHTGTRAKPVAPGRAGRTSVVRLSFWRKSAFAGGGRVVPNSSPCSFLDPPLQGEGDRSRSEWWRGVTLTVEHSASADTPPSAASRLPPPLAGEDLGCPPRCGEGDRSRSEGWWGLASSGALAGKVWRCRDSPPPRCARSPSPCRGGHPLPVPRVPKPPARPRRRWPRPTGSCSPPAIR